MKTIKHFTLAFLGIILMLGSCKKDDENTVPGEFTFDGKKYELQSCYFAKTAEFGPLYRLLMIVSKDITLTNTVSSVTGKGNIVLLGIQLPEGQTDFSSGDYTYESDPAYRLPSTFNGGFMVGFDSANGNSESESEMSNTTILKITKSGQNYTFSASGVTEDGKIFDFLYTGSLIQLQDYK